MPRVNPILIQIINKFYDKQLDAFQFLQDNISQCKNLDEIIEHDESMLFGMPGVGNAGSFPATLLMHLARVGHQEAIRFLMNERAQLSITINFVQNDRTALDIANENNKNIVPLLRNAGVLANKALVLISQWNQQASNLDHNDNSPLHQLKNRILAGNDSLTAVLRELVEPEKQQALINAFSMPERESYFKENSQEFVSLVHFFEKVPALEFFQSFQPKYLAEIIVNERALLSLLRILEKKGVSIKKILEYLTGPYITTLIRHSNSFIQLLKLIPKEDRSDVILMFERSWLTALFTPEDSDPNSFPLADLIEVLPKKLYRPRELKKFALDDLKVLMGAYQTGLSSLEKLFRLLEVPESGKRSDRIGILTHLTPEWVGNVISTQEGAAVKMCHIMTVLQDDEQKSFIELIAPEHFQKIFSCGQRDYSRALVNFLNALKSFSLRLMFINKLGASQWLGAEVKSLEGLVLVISRLDEGSRCPILEKCDIKYLQSLIQTHEDLKKLLQCLTSKDRLTLLQYFSVNDQNWLASIVKEQQSFTDICETFIKDESEAGRHFPFFFVSCLGGIKWIEALSEDDLNPIIDKSKQDDMFVVRNGKISEKNRARVFEYFSSAEKVRLLEKADFLWLQTLIEQEYGSLAHFLKAFKPVPEALIAKFESQWLRKQLVTSSILAATLGCLEDAGARRTLITNINSGQASFFYDLFFPGLRSFSSAAQHLREILCRAPEAYAFLNQAQLNAILPDLSSWNQFVFGDEELLPAAFESVIKVVGREKLLSLIEDVTKLRTFLTSKYPVSENLEQALINIFDVGFLQAIIQNARHYAFTSSTLSPSLRVALLSQLGGSQWIASVVQDVGCFVDIFTLLPDVAKATYLKELGQKEVGVSGGLGQLLAAIRPENYPGCIKWLSKIGYSADHKAFGSVLSIIPRDMVQELLIAVQDRLPQILRQPSDIKALPQMALARLPADIIIQIYQPKPLKTGLGGLFHRAAHSKEPVHSPDERVETEIIFLSILKYLESKSHEKGENQIRYQKRIDDFAGILHYLKSSPSQQKSVALLRFFSEHAAPEIKAGSADRYGELRRKLVSLGEDVLERRSKEFLVYLSNKFEPSSMKNVVEYLLNTMAEKSSSNVLNQNNNNNNSDIEELIIDDNNILACDPNTGITRQM